MKKVLLAVVALFALAVVCTAIGGNGEDGTAEETEAIQRPSVPGEATISIGDTTTTLRVTSAALRNRGAETFITPAEGKVFLTFNAEVENGGTEGDVDLNGSEYRLQVPTGEILDYQGYSADGDQAFQTGTTLPPGVKRAGTITWEVTPPTSGQQFVLHWKPNPFDEKQAQFTYTQS